MGDDVVVLKSDIWASPSGFVWVASEAESGWVGCGLAGSPEEAQTEIERQFSVFIGEEPESVIRFNRISHDA
jgi:hypothetical protein